MKKSYVVAAIISLLSLTGAPHSSSAQVVHTIVLPSMCRSHVWAQDFSTLTMDEMNAHPRPAFSFNPLHQVPDTLMTPCNIPAFGTPTPWNVWIQTTGEDLDGDGTLDWDAEMAMVQPLEIIFLEHSSCCCQPASSLTNTIKGNIRTAPAGEGVELVYVSFLQEGTVHPTYITNETGSYSLGPVVVTADSPLTISPDRNDNHKLGVTTIDLVRLQRHLLGIERITSPYQWIAADANNSQSLSAIDFVEMRKIILGINVEFTNSRSWRFIRSDIELPDTISMWPDGPFAALEDPNEYILTQIDTSIRYDFIGVKIGDITGAYDPNFNAPVESRTTPGTIRLESPSQALTAGEVIHIPIYVQEQTEVTAFQFTLAHPGLEFAGIQPGQITVSDDEIALFHDHMTMSWFDIGTVTLVPGQPLFTISFVSVVTGEMEDHFRLTSDITYAEWYSADQKVYQPELVFEDASKDRSRIEVSMTPNPWTDGTIIRLHGTYSGEIRLTITDLLGRPVHERTEMTRGPQHVISITADDVPLPGPYVYTVISSGSQVSGKMLRINP